VEDDAVFAAMSSVLLRVGWARLTLARVAREVGVTPAALHQRFGTKHDLLVAFYAWGTERLRATSARPPDPGRARPLLKVVGALVRGSVESITMPEQMVNAMSTSTDVATEPDLRPLAQERFALARRGMEAVLDEAVARGELAGIDAPRLAHQLHVSLVGASLVWSITGPQPLTDELLDVANLVLAPYLRGAGSDGPIDRGSDP
jgi:AcrR family transcriptional regulator